MKRFYGKKIVVETQACNDCDDCDVEIETWKYFPWTKEL